MAKNIDLYECCNCIEQGFGVGLDGYEGEKTLTNLSRRGTGHRAAGVKCHSGRALLERAIKPLMYSKYPPIQLQ